MTLHTIPANEVEIRVNESYLAGHSDGVSKTYAALADILIAPKAAFPISEGSRYFDPIDGEVVEVHEVDAHGRVHFHPVLTSLEYTFSPFHFTRFYRPLGGDL